MTTSAPAKKRLPYAVRKQTSGYSGFATWIVVRNPGGRRVSTWPHATPETAQAAADELNISEMVQPHEQDPRPYDERLAEARVAFREIVGR